MGISVLVPKTTSSIQATVEWGDYKRLGGEEKEGDGSAREQSRRTQGRQRVVVPIGAPAETPYTQDVPDSGGFETGYVGS